MVLKSGRRVAAGALVAYIRPSSSEHIARVAAIVGKKVFASAVRRHRLQRQVRHIMQGYIAERPSGYDVVVVAQPSAAKIRTIDDLQKVSMPILNALNKMIA